MDAPVANPAVMQVLLNLLEQQSVGSQMSHPYLHRLGGVSLGSEGFLERGGICAILIRPSDNFLEALKIGRG